MSNLLLKMLLSTGINYLLKIFNCICIRKVFPENWQEAIVISVPKPNKCKLNPNSYRQISLNNTMYKRLEKIVNRRLRWYIEIKKATQINTVSDIFDRVLTTLETNICVALLNEEYLAAVCLGI